MIKLPVILLIILLTNDDTFAGFHLHDETMKLTISSLLVNQRFLPVCFHAQHVCFVGDLLLCASRILKNNVNIH